MIKFYAPASIGNINVGFDLIGVAILPLSGLPLGDSIKIEKSDHFELINTGNFYNTLPPLKENIVYKCWKKFCKITNKKLSVTITLEKNMPIGSGLGSSASSVVASCVAINEFFKKPLNNIELLLLMGKLEEKISGSIHYDNVAPSFLGGMQLIIQKDKIISESIPIFKNWIWIISYPGIKISTMQARNILPKTYSIKNCITYGKNLATFIHAAYTKNSDLALKSMQDVIAEPHRIKLIPDFLKIRYELKKMGSLVFGISGSGPTIFCICKNYKNAKEISKWLEKNFIQNSTGFTHICSVDEVGTRKI